MKKLLLLSFVLFSFSSFAQVLLQDDFNYTVGDSLGVHGWVGHSGTTNYVSVVSPGLTYAGYAGSTATSGAKVMSTGNDVHYMFAGTPATTGAVYAAFLVNFSAAQTAGDYFFHLGNSPFDNNYRARTYCKLLNSALAFGIDKSSASTSFPTSYTAANYTVGTTYLFVVKYSFSTGTTSDDTVSLFVNPDLTGVEPAPTVFHTNTTAGNDLTNVGNVALRQGSSTNAPALTLDGIRVAQTWVEALGITTAVGNETAKAKTFGLDQNYPNPFNPSTMISFNLASNEFATLKVYDVLGNEVSTLVNGSMTAGQHQVSFDASKLTSGVYVYRLTAGNMVDTKKMTIMK